MFFFFLTFLFFLFFFSFLDLFVLVYVIIIIIDQRIIEVNCFSGHFLHGSVLDKLIVSIVHEKEILAFLPRNPVYYVQNLGLVDKDDEQDDLLQTDFQHLSFEADDSHLDCDQECGGLVGKAHFQLFAQHQDAADEHHECLDLHED